MKGHAILLVGLEIRSFDKVSVLSCDSQFKFLYFKILLSKKTTYIFLDFEKSRVQRRNI